MLTRPGTSLFGRWIEAKSNQLRGVGYERGVHGQRDLAIAVGPSLQQPNKALTEYPHLTL